MMSGIIHQKNSLKRVRDSQMSLTHTLEPPGIRIGYFFSIKKINA
jgi:hypothetical protein